jgi:uncharacterized protein
VSIENSRAILIFSKSPEPGRVKTRLQPFLDEEKSLQLHIALLKDSIQKTLQADADPILYLTHSSDLPFVPGIQVRVQKGDDLGERLLNALQETLRLYAKVIVIGTDSPAFPLSAFNEAFQRLDHHDVVIGPSEDGGYYLIAFASLIPEIFRGVPWGTPEVLNATLRLLGKRKVSLLERCFDIDLPADLERMKQELKQNDAPYLSYTREWFQKFVS